MDGHSAGDSAAEKADQSVVWTVEVWAAQKVVSSAEAKVEN
jgi:hypothetical protein